MDNMNIAPSGSLWNWIRTLSIGTTGVFCVSLVLLYYYQDAMLYLPQLPHTPHKPHENPRGYRVPSEQGLEDFETLSIETQDKCVIHGWLIKQPKSTTSPTIVFFHGNAGNIGFRLPNIRALFHATGANVCLVDYRGYGSSSGQPTEAGLVEDARSTVEYLRGRTDVLDIYDLYVFGRSLGGAVALTVARDYPQYLRGVILENTFLDIASMVDVIMPVWISRLKWLVLRISWSNQDIIPTVTLPILFLAGKLDEIVPHDHMVQLHALATKSTQKSIFIVDEGTHNDTWLKGGKVYFESVATFIQSCAVASAEEVCDAVVQQTLL